MGPLPLLRQSVVEWDWGLGIYSSSGPSSVPTHSSGSGMTPVGFPDLLLPTIIPWDDPVGHPGEEQE